MNMTEWAKREVEIACKKENPNRKDEEFDYGCACYESALKAFECLCKDGHSGMSMSITKNILNRLISGKPITPIEDSDDIWDTVNIVPKGCGYILYQCNRMSSLFKKVYDDGKIVYSDNNRFISRSISNPNSSWSNSFVNKIVEENPEIGHITFPYYPPTTPINIYCEDFLHDKNNGDYDTIGIFYVIKSDGTRVEINRFFTEKGSGFEEITCEEYFKLKEESVMMLMKISTN